MGIFRILSRPYVVYGHGIKGKKPLHLMYEPLKDISDYYLYVQVRNKSNGIFVVDGMTVWWEILQHTMLHNIY